jgi:hypothetical protein
MLSSRTVFIFSIQRASTGPSKTIQDLSSPLSRAAYLHNLRSETIMPFLRDFINLTIKFTHGYGLRVEDDFLNNLVSIIWGVFLSQ